MPGGRPRAAWHGTADGYRNHACRCKECTDAHRSEKRRTKQTKVDRMVEGQPLVVMEGGSRAVTERDVLEMAYDLTQDPNPVPARVQVLGNLLRWLEASRKQDAPKEEFTDPTLRMADTG